MKASIVLLVSVLIVGCAGIKREVHYIREKEQTTKIDVVSPEDSLLKYPCQPIPAGDSLIELAINYNKNVTCIKKYQIQIEKIRKDIRVKEFEANEQSK